MEKLSPTVLESFGLQNRGIKKEKGHCLCNTAEGLVKIHTTYESPETIKQQYLLKEHLAKDFPQTDRYRLTKTGQPYIIVGRETYIATNYPTQYKELDFEDEEAVLETFRALAALHTASKVMPVKMTISPPLPEIYTRYLNELTQSGKQARRVPRMSDFDVSFIKHAPKVIEIIQEAIERLEKTSYSQLYSNAIQQSSLCHNSLKEENLLSTQDAMYIVNFSHATTDLQLCDLAALIRRYAQRSNKSIHIGKLIDTYNTKNPLPHHATDILYTQLIFPWAFVKLVSQYYSKKRNWTPNGLITRMESVIAERECYEDYIRGCLN